MVRKVIVGVPGSGKTRMAIDIVEREIRNGVKWHQIGFSSFSRAACLEAAERAAKIIGESPDTLQKSGFFRTVHSSAFRCLGIDSKAILDHASADGKKFLKEAVGSDRCGEPGTQSGKLDDALNAWDLCRARLTLLPRDGDGLIDLLSIDGQTDEKGTQYPLKDTRVTHGSCASVPQKTQCFTEDFARSDVAGSTGTIRDTENEIVRFQSQKSSQCEYCVTNEYIPIGDSRLRFGQTDGAMWIRAGCVYPEKRSSDEMRVIGRIRKEKRLIQKYERHKKLYGRIDYTDILLLYSGIAVNDDLTFTETYPAGSVPEEVEVWLFDEHQDSSALLARTAQRLSEAAQDVYLLGDGFQAVYGFSGASTALFRAEEIAARDRGDRIVLNRSWRNTDSVIEWGEEILKEDKEYESREPFGEAGEGSVGLMERIAFDQILPSLAGTDTLIIARAWFSLDKIKATLDGMAIPWRSCQEDKASRWQCPAKIAFTLVMRELMAGLKISEQDWRRVTVELPAKWSGQELFVRGTKSKWKKFECSNAPKLTLLELDQWGATEWFVEFVRKGKWKTDMPLLLDRAIDSHGIAEVRSPSIRLGSVHSVKGLESRNVFCLADSTMKVANEGDESEERCLKYVAVTRSSMHYRLVVNSLDIARGKPLFWAAPRGEKKYVGFDDPGPKRKQDSVGDTEDAEQDPFSMGCEVSCDSLWDSGDAGHPDLLQGQVHSDGSEDREGNPVRDAENPAEEDSCSEWDLGGGSKFG